MVEPRNYRVSPVEFLSHKTAIVCRSYNLPSLSSLVKVFSVIYVAHGRFLEFFPILCCLHRMLWEDEGVYHKSILLEGFPGNWWPWLTLQNFIRIRPETRAGNFWQCHSIEFPITDCVILWTNQFFFIVKSVELWENCVNFNTHCKMWRVLFSDLSHNPNKGKITLLFWNNHYWHFNTFI